MDQEDARVKERSPSSSPSRLSDSDIVVDTSEEYSHQQQLVQQTEIANQNNHQTSLGGQSSSLSGTLPKEGTSFRSRLGTQSQNVARSSRAPLPMTSKPIFGKYKPGGAGNISFKSGAVQMQHTVRFKQDQWSKVVKEDSTPPETYAAKPVRLGQNLQLPTPTSNTCNTELSDRRVFTTGNSIQTYSKRSARDLRANSGSKIRRKLTGNRHKSSVPSLCLRASTTQRQQLLTELAKHECSRDNTLYLPEKLEDLVWSLLSKIEHEMKQNQNNYNDNSARSDITPSEDVLKSLHLKQQNLDQVLSNNNDSLMSGNTLGFIESLETPRMDKAKSSPNQQDQLLVRKSILRQTTKNNKLLAGTTNSLTRQSDIGVKFRLKTNQALSSSSSNSDSLSSLTEEGDLHNGSSLNSHKFNFNEKTDKDGFYPQKEQQKRASRAFENRQSLIYSAQKSIFIGNESESEEAGREDLLVQKSLLVKQETERSLQRKESLQMEKAANRRRQSSLNIHRSENEGEKRVQELTIKEFSTARKIENVFWVGEDNIFIISKDKVLNDFYLEAYSYACKTKPIDEIKLVSAKDFPVFYVAWNKFRNFASILQQEINIQERSIVDQNLFIFDLLLCRNSQKKEKKDQNKQNQSNSNSNSEASQLSFSQSSSMSSDQSDNDAGFSLKRGMKCIKSHQFPGEAKIERSRCRIFQLFSHHYSLDGVLQIYYQYSVRERRESLMNTFQNGSSEQNLRNQQQKYHETFRFEVDPACLFEESSRNTIRLSVASKAGGANSQNIGGPYRSQTALGLDKKLRLVNFQFRDEKILGCYRLSNKLNIVVYSDGFIQREDRPWPVQNGPENNGKNNHIDLSSIGYDLILPFQNQRATTCEKCDFATNSPMLIFQSQQHQIVGFVFKDKRYWHRQFSIEAGLYDIRRAFGNFIIVSSFKDRKLRLLEIGGKNENSICTDMVWGTQLNSNPIIEACPEHTNYVLLYEKGESHFQWYTQDQQRYLFFTKQDEIVQLCGGFKVKLSANQSQITLYDANCCNPLKDWENFLLSVEVPEELAMTKIQTFLPAINPSKTLMAIAVCYQDQRQSTDMWFEDKYRALFFIDLENHQTFTGLESQDVGHYRNIFFSSENMLVLQGRQGCFRVEFGSEKVSRPTMTSFDASNSSQEQTTFKSNLLSVPSPINTEQQREKKEAKFAQLKKKEQSEQRGFIVEQKFLLQHSLDDMTLFQVSKEQAWLISSTKNQIFTLIIPQSPIKFGIEISQEEQNNNDINLKAVFDLKRPASVKISKGHTRWLACHSQDENSIYALFTQSHCSWLSIISIQKNKQTQDQFELLTQSENPWYVPIQDAVNICEINSLQICIQSVRSFCIYNTESAKVDFKFNFVAGMGLDITTTENSVAVPRLRNGLIANIGPMRKHDQLQKEKIQRFNFMNDLLAQFTQLYFQKENVRASYLCIDEFMVNWDSRYKLLPVKIMNPDYVRFEDDKGAQLKIRDANMWEMRDQIETFEEIPLLCLMYNNYTSIYDTLIRYGILKGRVEINDSQLTRICSPSLFDRNNSLLHHLSRNSLSDLSQIFTRTQIHESFNQETKRFVFFRNFDGKSPLDIAIDAFDLQSFQFLLSQLINLQNGMESSHLIDTVLLKAMKLDLDLKSLFESRLCSMLISRETFQHQDQYPEFHWNSQTKSTEFKGSWGEFISGRRVYFDLFSKYFEKDSIIKDETDKSYLKFKESKQLERAIKNYRGEKEGLLDSNEDNKHPIWYQVDYLMTWKSERKNIRSFVEALAKTKNMQIFQTGFIQRFLNHQLNKGSFIILYLMLSFFVVTYALLILNVILLDYPLDSKAADWRFYSNCVNSGLIGLSMIVFEVRQMKNEGLEYFTDTTNQNDLLFIFVFFATFWCDTHYGTSSEDSDHYQTTRILLTILLFSGFVKLMALTRIFGSIGFIVRMIYKVTVQLAPFLSLYICLVWMFAIIMFTLGVKFDSEADEIVVVMPPSPDVDLSLPDQSQTGRFLKSGGHGGADSPSGDNPYHAIGFFGYFIFAFQQSMGEFEVDKFADLPYISQVFVWLSWLFFVFMNTIVFLNFLIAVISDVYSQVMETHTEEIFKRKAQLIVELDQFFGDWEGKPQRILVTRSGKYLATGSQWSGFISEIKKCIIQQRKAIEQAVIRSSEAIIKDGDERHRESQESIKQVQGRMLAIEGNLAAQRISTQESILSRSGTRSYENASLLADDHQLDTQTAKLNEKRGVLGENSTSQSMALDPSLISNNDLKQMLAKAFKSEVRKVKQGKSELL